MTRDFVNNISNLVYRWLSKVCRFVNLFCGCVHVRRVSLVPSFTDKQSSPWSMGVFTSVSDNK